MTREELEREVRRFDHDGVINTEQMVKTARKESHPLHASFTWDDKVAGHRYRLGEAAALVRRIVEPVEDEPGVEPVLVRSYVSRPQDRAHDPRTFVARRLMLADTIDRLDVMLDALERAHGLLSNIGAAELAPVLHLVNAQLHRLKRERMAATLDVAA
jgi:hypothetical protein